MSNPLASNIDWRTPAKFALNGATSTIVHFAALVMLMDVVHIGSAGLANGCAAVFGITSSYLGNRSFVFNSTVAHAQALPSFLLLYGVAMLVHVAVLTAWTDYAGFRYELGFLIATSASLMLTFVGNRYFVFVPAARSD